MFPSLMKNALKMGLKYCERCGGLWLREHGSEQIYCPKCTPMMREMPAATDVVLGGMSCA